MKKTILSLSAMAVLAACGGDKDEANPISGGPQGVDIIPTDETEVAASGIPANLAENVVAASFNETAQTLTLTLTSLDASNFSQSYQRETALDVPGYQTFVQQENPLNRMFVAVAGTSPDGTVSAIAVTDGGQFNRFFGGGNYSRNGNVHSLPTAGLVTYAGTYAAVTNVGVIDTGDQLLPVPAGTSDSVRPRQPLQVQGEIIINADFTDNSVNGQIFNRQLLRVPTGATTSNVALNDLSLVETSIADDGTFAGEVEFSPSQDPSGNYGGVFGGNSASAVAGITHLTEFEAALDNEEEFGAFTLGRCGTAGDAALCDALTP